MLGLKTNPKPCMPSQRGGLREALGTSGKGDKCESRPLTVLHFEFIWRVMGLSNSGYQ